MYLCMNTYEGTPPRLYRSPDEIRRDMRHIIDKITEQEEMLSVHNLLLEMIPSWAEKSPERWIPELEEMVAEACEALDTIKRLKGALEYLTLELEDVKCMMQK